MNDRICFVSFDDFSINPVLENLFFDEGKTNWLGVIVRIIFRKGKESEEGEE